MQNKDYYWWQVEDSKSYEPVFGYVRHLDKSQSYRNIDNLRHMRLYGNSDIMSYNMFSSASVDTAYNVKNRVTLNIVKSMVDTAVNKITKNKPKPTFLTEGANWGLQQKAKKLSKFTEGVFYSTDMYKKGVIAFKDACIFGTGVLKIFKQDGNIKVERVFIDELKVDDTESFYNEPRQIHQTKHIHKDVLINMFPKAEGAINSIKGGSESLYQSGPNSKKGDMIEVIESWRLPSGKTATDGKHVINIENFTLFEEDYTKDHFPFVFFKWSEKPIGFFGGGLAEELQGIQVEINKILRTIQVSMHLVSIPKLFVESGSKIVSAHLNNKIGGIIKYAGTKPSYDILGAIPPDLFNHLEFLYQRAYEIAGISQISAQAAKPNLSGKALREYSDLDSERFLAIARDYEDSYMKAAKIMIEIAKDLAEEEEGFTVKVSDGKTIETLDWKEVSIDEDNYMMKIFPTSALSSTPAGRLQDVQELLSAGFIDANEGIKLLDFPDLESYYNRRNAASEDIERTIDLMVNKGKFLTPEPYQDLKLGINMVQDAYLYFRTQSVPEERLELLRQWIEDANFLTEQANQEAMAQQAAAAAPPAGIQQPLLEQGIQAEPVQQEAIIPEQV